MKVKPEEYSAEAHALVAGLYTDAVESGVSGTDIANTLIVLTLADEVIKLQKEVIELKQKG